MCSFFFFFFFFFLGGGGGGKDTPGVSAKGTCPVHIMAVGQSWRGPAVTGDRVCEWGGMVRLNEAQSPHRSERNTVLKKNPHIMGTHPL